jgi:CheY-like chemotaxis protein
MTALNRILMVEDETDIQEVAQLALEAVGGFTVCICSSGPEALQQAPLFAPDLILLDVMMSGMDGPSTLLALRQMPQFVSTPVIFMTAKVQSHEVARYKSMGGLDVISKPFDPMTLSGSIVEIWTRHHMDNAT